jgi:MFS family permease
MAFMLELYRKHKAYLTFGTLTLFFSGIGQTYLISLFNSDIQKEFGLTTNEQSYVYSLATFAASLCLPFIGRLIDKKKPLFMAIIIGVLLALGTLSLRYAFNVLLLFLSYFVIRFLGQASISMVATTFIARTFGKYRGKAMAFCALGRSVAEGVFPFIVTTLMLHYGWKNGITFLSMIILFIYVPFSYFLLKNGTPDEPIYEEKEEVSDLQFNKSGNLSDVYKDKRIYLISMANAILPFVMTGIFFHHAILLTEKGWTLALWGQSFMLFSTLHIISSLISGYLIDKYSARHLLPFILIPLLLAFLAFYSFSGNILCWIFLGLIGLSLGCVGNIRSAFYAEIYGTKNLGTIKSIDSTLMVISTSIAPTLYGLALGHLNMDQFIMTQIWTTIIGIVIFFYCSIIYGKKTVTGPEQSI